MFTIIGADGNEYGPVTIDQVNGWIATGRANLQTKARRTGETEWTTLGEFSEFTAPPVLPVNQPPPPPSVTPVALPQARNHDLASRWARLGSALLDSFIGSLFVIPGILIMVSAGVFIAHNHPNPALLIGGFSAMGAGLLILLAIQIYLLSTRGQTIGKKIVGIKIVNFDDGTNPGFVKAFLLRVFVNGLIGFVPLYSLVDLLFIFRADQRCIHDLLANTVVVKA